MKILVDNVRPIGEQPDWFQLADSIGDMVWTSDLELRLTYINRAFTRLLKYETSEARQKTLIDVCTKEFRDIITQKIAEELKKDKYSRADRLRTWTIELKHEVKDGKIVFTETKMGFVRDSKDKPVGLIGVSRDITEHRRQQNVLHQSRLFSVIGEMTSAIAAEINNPVGGILLSSEQLMLGNISGQVKKDLTVIHSEAKRMARLMSTLLNSYSYETRNMERYKVHRLINKVLEIRKYGHEIHNITVSTDFQKLPIYVLCVKSQLQQVLTCLIKDSEIALQKRKDGYIVISSRKQGNWVKIDIADNRKFVSGEHEEHMSGSLFTNIAANTEITRLDMIMCQTIVGSHGGQLYAEENHMGGITFIIELPVFKSRYYS